MSALDNLFGLRRLLVNGAPVLNAAGKEVFAQTFNLLGGWTVAIGVDENSKPTLELTPPGGGGGGTGDVVGPGVSVADRIAVFNGTTGKLVKDGGSTIAAVLASALASAQTYANSVGAAVTSLIPAPGAAPVNVTKAAASAGSGSSYARDDHKHDVSTAAPGAFSVTGVVAAEGSSTSLARADHAHALTGALPVGNGGTGLTSAALGAIMIGTGTGWKAWGPTSVSYTADASVTKTIADAFRFYLNDNGLTTGRTFTVGTGGSPSDGMVLNFICEAPGANHYTLDWGNGTKLINVKMWIDLRYTSGTGWTLSGLQPVA